MIRLFCFILTVLALPLRSKLRLEAENAVLRHQLIILRRRLHGRVGLTNRDRWFFIRLYRWFPSILKVPTIIRPEMLVRWHSTGPAFGATGAGGCVDGREPPVEILRALIRRMSTEFPPASWGLRARIRSER